MTGSPAARRACHALLLGVVLAAEGASCGARSVGAQAPAVLPKSELAVWTDAGAWAVLWRSDSAPSRYSSARRFPVREVPGRIAPGVVVGRYRLRGSGEAWRTELVVVSLSPDSLRLTLDTAFVRGRRAWTLDRVPPTAFVAVNAGQFVADLPWGWVVLDGRQFLPPAPGPLVSTVTIDASGRVSLTHGGRVPSAGDVRWAFQSYPTLLDSGMVPVPLRGGGGGVDLAHRDARLALGRRPDGTVVIAMTRFGALGERLGSLPFGLTTAEMAAVMGLLGAQDAVLLDGGISAQLQLRGSDGVPWRFPGLRSIPLALLASPTETGTARK